MRMACLLLCVLTACGQSWPSPAPDRGQIHVMFSAHPRPGTEKLFASTYGAQGAFETVDYSHLNDITVCLLGENLGAGGPLPRRRVIELGRGREPDIVVIPVGGTLVIDNRDRSPRDIFAAGPGGFDVTVPARGQLDVVLERAGEFEVIDDSTGREIRLIVLGHEWSLSGRAGEEALFDHVPPGTYTLRMHAPRLADRDIALTVRAGERVTVSVDVGVGPAGDR